MSDNIQSTGSASYRNRNISNPDTDKVQKDVKGTASASETQAASLGAAEQVQFATQFKNILINEFGEELGNAIYEKIASQAVTKQEGKDGSRFISREDILVIIAEELNERGLGDKNFDIAKLLEELKSASGTQAQEGKEEVVRGPSTMPQYDANIDPAEHLRAQLQHHSQAMKFIERLEENNKLEEMLREMRKEHLMEQEEIQKSQGTRVIDPDRNV